MPGREYKLSDRAVLILRLIADGCTYKQILIRHPGLTYEDIFNAAVEALKLAEHSQRSDREAGAAVSKTTATVEPSADSVSPRSSQRNPRRTEAPGIQAVAGETAADTATQRAGLPYHERMAEIKETAPRAYERWTDEEQEKLKELHGRGLSARQIAGELERQPSAIRSRLAKLGLAQP